MLGAGVSYLLYLVKNIYPLLVVFWFCFLALAFMVLLVLYQAVRLFWACQAYTKGYSSILLIDESNLLQLLLCGANLGY